jgi:hypothetical protein
METTYGIIMGVILLFPWSLVGMMVAGAVWSKIRTSERLRIPAGQRSGQTACNQSRSLPRV